MEKLVKPALGCFSDPDQRIRYYACEALYNICKVARGSVLDYFNDIFDGLSKVSGNTMSAINTKVCSAKLMKDSSIAFNLYLCNILNHVITKIEIIRFSLGLLPMRFIV